MLGAEGFGRVVVVVVGGDYIDSEVGKFSNLGASGGISIDSKKEPWFGLVGK